MVCRAYNSCGWGEYKTVGLNVYNTSSYSIAYLSPANDVLTVSFNPELVSQTKASLQASASARTKFTSAFALTIKLYNDSGTLCREATSAGEDVTFDVSNLKNGLYILHVHDGIAAKPEVQKILISH